MKTLPSLKIVSRTISAIKAHSLGKIGTLINDIAKYHFARYCVLDCYGTVKFCWKLDEAHKWLKFCAPALARIVDTHADNKIVAERKHFYVAA